MARSVARIRKIAQRATKGRVDRGVVRRIDEVGNCVDILLPGSSTVTRNIKVIGSVYELEIGDVVSLIWIDQRPVVVHSGAYSYTSSNQTYDFPEIVDPEEIPSGIILVHTSGQEEGFPVTEEGLENTLFAAEMGALVKIPAAKLTGDFTVPADVSVTGISPASTAIYGKVTAADGASFNSMSMINHKTISEAAKALVGPAEGNVDIRNCTVLASNCGTGDAYAIEVDDGVVICRQCTINGEAVDGDGYAFNFTGTGETTVYDSSVFGSTADYSDDDLANVSGTTEGSSVIECVADGNEAIVASGTDVRYTADISATTPDWDSKLDGPTAIIDADADPVDKNTYFALEVGEIWKTANLTTGGDWTSVYEVADFDGGTDLVFTRIRCTRGKVFVIGYALKENDNWAAFCFRSIDGGTEWEWFEIEEIEEPETYAATFTVDPYYVDNGSITKDFNGGGGSIYFKILFKGSLWQNTEDYTYIVLPEALPSTNNACTIPIEYDVMGNFPSTDYNTVGDGHPFIWDTNCSPTVIDGGFHYAGYLNTDVHMAGDRSRILAGWIYGYPGRWQNSVVAQRDSYITNLVVDGVPYGSRPTQAFDISPKDGALYMGCEQLIYKSTDDGATWAAMPTEEGATDICADPTEPATIYYWCTDGILKKAVGSEEPTELLTESRQNYYLTIARDADSDRLFAITAAALKMYHSASWSTLVASVQEGRGLRSFSNNRVVYLESEKIWHSSDYGENFVDKTGDYSGLDSARVIHLLGAD